ncbi:hypothetical protein GJAV_G00055770 [Gymnothorax javanicus]|nr:hypothetical protein GJAV_G00055770 [Gymnothorax javanicus]
MSHDKLILQSLFRNTENPDLVKEWLPKEQKLPAQCLMHSGVANRRANQQEKGIRTLPLPQWVQKMQGMEHQGPDLCPQSPPQSTEPPPKPEEVPLGMDVKIEPKMVGAVEQQTRGQSHNPAWYAWRKNRITASIAHQISRSHFANGRGKSPPISYLKAITGEKRGVKTRAMTWGIENEAKAVWRYKQLKSKLLGGPVVVKECGLYIDPEHAWLAASPDGIVMDTMTGEVLGLEIKCPYKHRDHTVAEACAGDKQFCLELRPDPQEGESPYQLKTNHSYYTQVQCQMAVLGHLKVDFVVYTKRDIAIVPVHFDREFWDSTLAKLGFFFKNAVLPYLQSKGEGGPLLQREE